MEVKLMDDEIMIKFLKEGTLSIPTIILKNYHQLGMNETELTLLLQMMIVLKDDNCDFDFEMVAQLMEKDQAEIYKMLHNLIENGIVNLTSTVDENGRNHDQYSFEPLYHKIVKILKEENQQGKKDKKATARKQVFDKIEQSFGRTLSSFDIELIDSWLNQDHYDPELIIAALKEAVLSNVYNLKYIDKILLEWEKKGIKQPADIQRIRDQRQQNEKKRQKGNLNKPIIPLSKWSSSD